MIASKFRMLVFAVVCASLAFVLFVPFAALAVDWVEDSEGLSARALEKAIPVDCLLQDVGSLVAQGEA